MPIDSPRLTAKIVDAAPVDWYDPEEHRRKLADLINQIQGRLNGYRSPPQTISRAGNLTLAHGLGDEPSRVIGILECTIAESNWSVGDRILLQLGASGYGVGGVTIVSVQIDEVNIRVGFNNQAPNQQIVIQNRTTNNPAFLTNANWTLEIRAFL